MAKVGVRGNQSGNGFTPAGNDDLCARFDGSNKLGEAGSCFEDCDLFHMRLAMLEFSARAVMTNGVRHCLSLRKFPLQGVARDDLRPGLV